MSYNYERVVIQLNSLSVDDNIYICMHTPCGLSTLLRNHQLPLM